MECPECHAHSVVVRDGQKKCEAKGCTYLYFHVITYQNQIRQFQGEKSPENRYSTGLPSSKDNKVQKNYTIASKVIQQLATIIGLSSDIVDKAEAKLITILKIKYTQKKKAKEQKSQTGEKSNDKRIKTSDSFIAAFSLYLACFDKKLYFKDVRIANELGIRKKDWEGQVKDLRTQLQTFMEIPSSKLEYDVLRVATKRKINLVEVNAMLEMAKRIKDKSLLNGYRYSTIAACIFWQIMRRSSRYNKDQEKFEIRKYLKKAIKKEEEEEEYWTQKQFQCSYEAIRQFKNQVLGSKLLQFIPQFQTRIPEDKLKVQ